QQEMPDFLPDRLEAGTHNVPGIAGLLAGVRYVRRRGLEKILDRERRLTRQMAGGLREIPGLRVYAAASPCRQAGVLSLTAEGMDAETLGSALAERGIAVRAGLHCAPLAHRTVGTLDTGTVRLSFSDLNTPEEVDRVISVLRVLLKGTN
ncbi:MAG: aminotransferase class V-fold PLP-dependent enzyme, partial [Oscillibacter sp.]|nr:aminotransferase class V-fold PLP-dependent enzyme [Oscillibacter sp.]